jgi:hypothetical protein
LGEGRPERMIGKFEELQSFRERKLVFVERLEDGGRNAGKEGRLIRARGPSHIGQSVHEVVGDNRGGHPLPLA